jgi:hypothetical protein
MKGRKGRRKGKGKERKKMSRPLPKIIFLFNVQKWLVNPLQASISQRLKCNPRGHQASASHPLLRALK